MNRSAIILFLFLSGGAFADHCVKNDVKGEGRNVVERMVDEANKSGSYLVKKTFGKDELIRVGEKFRVKKSRMACVAPEDCKVVGFCLGSKYSSSKSFGLVPGTGGYQHHISNHCVSLLVNVERSGKFEPSCLDIDDIERVR